jgi:hypothetical protein
MEATKARVMILLMTQMIWILIEANVDLGHLNYKAFNKKYFDKSVEP